jgi:hypothetical protein
MKNMKDEHNAARTMSGLAVFVGLALSAVLIGSPVLAQQAQPAPGQEGYVPVKSLPAGQVKEGLPAAPLVVGAYAFVWAVLIVYLWTVWRRLGKVQAEIADLERRVSDRRP